MASGTVKKGGLPLHHPYRPYAATVNGYDILDSRFKEGEKYMRIRYKVDDGPDFDDSREVYDNCGLPMTVQPNNKAADRYETITGQSLAAGATVDYDEMVGKRCIVLFAPHEDDEDREVVFKVRPWNPDEVVDF